MPPHDGGDLRQQVQEQPCQHYQQLVQVQRIAQVGSWEWDLGSGHMSGSEEFYRLFGLEPGATLPVGLVIETLVHPDDRPAVRALAARIAEDPAAYELECRIVRPDGQTRTLLCRGEGVRDERGRVVRVVGTNQDVTKAKLAEQERQQLLARLYEVLEGQHQQLAADLHDGHLQSLAAIGLRIDQVRHRLDQASPQPVRELLDGLRHDVTEEQAALRRTIAALRPLILDQRGLVAAVRELATATGERAGLVSCQVTDNLDGVVLDREVETVLFRVAQQALANVEQHAAARRVQVGLDRDGAEVVLVVEDDGRGLDPAQLDRGSGAGGLGLTSMRERVEAVGGRFVLRSHPGRGTRIQARVLVAAS